MLEASGKMGQSSYAATLVDGWVRTQPDAARYLTAHVDELGGSEAVVNAIFHAALIDSCFKRSQGRSVPPMSFADLDHASTLDGEKDLRTRQPALLDYLVANVEDVQMRKLLTLLTLGMDFAS